MPNRSFWIEAKESLEQNSKTTPTSVKILGIGILFVAFLILSVGLIIGLKFPGFVEERIVEEQCIVSTENSHYHKWVFDEQWIRYEKVYFWSTTNHLDVITSDATPTFEQKGPYIYRKIASKRDIHFRDGYVAFKYMVNFIFDEEKTKDKCGQHCSEDEKIVLVNEEQIKEFVNYKSADDFALGNIPDWINSKIKDLIATQTNITGNIFSSLGSLDDAVPVYQDVDAQQIIGNTSFGSWIGLNNTDEKKVVTMLRNDEDFTAEEMTQFYDTLSDQNLMGLPDSIDKVEACTTFVHKTACSNKYLHLNGSIYGTSYSLNNELDLTFSNFRNICGLLLLLKYLNETNLNCFVNSSEWVGGLFCANNDINCEQLFSNHVYKTHFLLTVKDFIFEFLYENAKRFSLSKAKENFLTVKNVKQLSIGYQNKGAFVHGILTRNMTREPYNCFGITVKFSTCLLQRQSSNNMIIYDFQAFDTLPTRYHHDPLYTYFIPPLVDFKTCSSHNPSLEVFNHLSEEYACSIKFKQEKEIDYSGLDLFRYIQVPTESSTNNNFCCNNGHLYLKNSFAGSVIDIEPLSGKFWRKVIQQRQHIDVSAVRNVVSDILNISMNTFPVFLRISSIEISSYGVAEFKSKMKKMMDASCVGMITLSMLSSFVFVFAVGILVWPQKTKVHPFILEQSHNLGHHLSNNVGTSRV